ncbi:MAG: hypothetical protein NC911_06865, partial [Candidatus Omnitrophica bacterium]|nr:hypothetical protein [Candidatus Omnitrophota bacterium]
MKIEFSNLPLEVRKSVEEDIASAEKNESARKILTGLRLSLIALEEDGIPSGLPACQVEKPQAVAPISFLKRARWETVRQSFQLVPKGENLWVIAGGKEGVLYGVQEVLRCLTGIIWAGLRDEDIIFGQKKPLPAGVQKPLFPYRGRDGTLPGTDARTFSRWMNRNRWNLWRKNSAYWVKQDEIYRKEITDACSARCIHLTLGDHAMNYFLPEEEFTKHPEWFGLRNGHRVLKAPVVIPDCPHL